MTEKCINVLSLLCTVYFETNPVNAIKLLNRSQFSEPSDRAATTLIGWLCGDKVPAEGQPPALLQDDSTMQRKEWALHSKSSVIGEHQSVYRSTKKHCCPSTVSFHSNPGCRGFPKESPDFVHICATALPPPALVGTIQGQQAGCKLPLCWP